MSKQRGFSLIELLIVVAIILIIAAIAIPNLLRSRMAANEASAVSSMRSLNTAELTFNATYGSGYTENLTRLGPPAAGSQADSNRADIVDQILAGMGTGGTATSFINRNFLFGLPAIENIHASASQRVQCFLREDHRLRASLSGSPKTVQSASKPSFFRQLSIPGG